MGFDFHVFGDNGLSEDFVDWLVDEQWIDIATYFGRLWDYYHNCTSSAKVRQKTL